MGVTINKKKASGDWYVWISHKGQRTSRKIGKDKRTAMKVATMYRKKLALEEVDFSNGRNEQHWIFGDFFDDYLNKVAKHRLKRSSWHSYKKLAELHLLPVWKKKRIDEIKRQDVKRLLLDKQARGLIINNIRVCISAIFTEAVEREMIESNPARNLGKVFRNNRHKTQPQFLSKEQTATLLKAAQEHEPKYYDFLLTVFRTGLRLGELLALAWDCVNFDTKQIIVRRNFSHNYWDTPKSHKIRYVDMSDSLLAALQNRYHNRNKKLGYKLPDSKTIYLVFPNLYGKPFSSDYFRRARHRGSAFCNPELSSPRLLIIRR